MYRRPKFLDVLIEIRREMARVADYEMDLFVEMIRNGEFSNSSGNFDLKENNETNKTSEKLKPEIGIFEKK